MRHGVLVIRMLGRERRQPADCLNLLGDAALKLAEQSRVCFNVSFMVQVER